MPLFVDDPVVIDAQTQPGFAGTPLVQLTGAFADCFDIIGTANGSTVRGFVMNNCATALNITAASTVVTGNYIGTNAAGTAMGGNGNATGVYVNASNCTIGGPTASDRNVISGNSTGVFIEGATGVVVEGNYIGVDAAGTTRVANPTSGVTIQGTSPSNTISGNVVSGSFYCVYLTGTGVTNTVITGNLIGTNAAGTAAASGAGNNGVMLDRAANNRIGGTTAAERNVISGNGSQGITISGTGSNGNVVEGNYVGTDINGTTAVPNSGYAISIQSGASNNTIGGTAAGAGNVISGNGGIGVGVSAPGNLIVGNLIGTNASGTAALANGAGIFVSAASVTIGGTTAAARNVISGNRGPGIALQSGSNGAVIQGNFIGTDISGTSAIGNASEGVSLFGITTGATVGGTAAGARNVIAASGTSCLEIANSSNVVVQGNYIGTDVNGSVALGCHFSGIDLAAATNNQIGGTAPGAGNVISGSEAGVSLSSVPTPSGSTQSTGNTIAGNLIGTNAAGTAALANFVGLDFSGGSGNTIGGTAAGAGNVISGNTDDGVSIRTGCNNNVIQGNYVGVNAGGTAIPNGSYGVFDNGGNGNQIGGTAQAAGNRIRSNARIGVWIAAGTGNAIRQNSIASNVGGISLGPGGLPNDDRDPDTGANNLQNFPIVTSAVLSGGNTIVSGTLNSTPSTAFDIDLFDNTTCDSSGRGQGETYVASVHVTTDSSGNATFTTTVPSTLNIVTGTATDPSGNTSEFSACMQAAQTYLSINNVTMDEGNSGTTPMTFTVTAAPPPTITATVQFATAAGTATPGFDYTTTSGTLTFNPGESTKTIVVPILGDQIYEPNESFTVVLSGATNAALSKATGAGTIVNDDLPPPVVSSIDPAAGPVRGGTSVTITGTNFQQGITVTLGGFSATNVTWVDAMHLTAVTPSHTAGTATVVVSNPDGQSSSLSIGFTYRPSGDANNDGNVDAADVFYLLTFLFGGGPAPVAGDVTGDGRVNAADVFYLINYLFANGPAPK